jgi:exopolysaccharide biosynthesis predicted pyruvyltransferase EpsI
MRCHIPLPSEVALIGYPNHPNVGDSAIWLGERAWLSHAGHRVVYVADLVSYSPRAMARAIGQRGIILLHGGGNLGDIWPMHQALRERVMREFSGHRIIQLPQTAHFTDRRALERARDVFESCSDLVLIAREHQTQSRLKHWFNVQVDLAPDPAFVLGPHRAGTPAVEVVWLARTDSEAARHLEPSRAARVQAVDWIADDVDIIPGISDRRLRSLVQTWGRRSRRIPPATAAFQRALLPAFDFLASRRVAYGLGLLTTSRYVVTDRLHAHILCLLLATPHVVVDTGYGKLQSFADTWTRTCEGVCFARNGAEALEIVSKLAAPRLPKGVEPS